MRFNSSYPWICPEISMRPKPVSSWFRSSSLFPQTNPFTTRFAGLVHPRARSSLTTPPGVLTPAEQNRRAHCALRRCDRARGSLVSISAVDPTAASPSGGAYGRMLWAWHTSGCNDRIPHSSHSAGSIGWQPEILPPAAARRA